jgi:predicted nucleotidyltransferase
MTHVPIIEGFAVETQENTIFTVKGMLHPPDRVIAYLRYVPEPNGDRWRRGVAFRRVYHFEEQIQLLRSRFPDYLATDPVLGIQAQSVPRTRIRSILNPCAYLDKLRQTGPQDPVEADALTLAEEVRQAADVPRQSMGISGSIMLSIYRPDSDIDLVVYGESEAKVVYKALVKLLSKPDGPIRRLREHELQALHAAHQPDTPLSFAEFQWLQERKINEGRYRDRTFFVRFVKQPSELGERYGQRGYQFVGRATLRARVCHARDVIFTPCVYGIDGVKFLNGAPIDDVREVVSFRGRFSDQARSGELVEVHGGIERVVSKTGNSYHRLVVGGHAGDYMKVWGEAKDENRLY